MLNKAAAVMCSCQDQYLIGQQLAIELLELAQTLPSHPAPTEDAPLHRVAIADKQLIVTAKSMNQDDQPWGVLLLLQDFTDYETIANELESTKRLEKTLQTVVENAYDGLILIDERGKVQIVNNAVCDLVSRERSGARALISMTS